MNMQPLSKKEIKDQQRKEKLVAKELSAQKRKIKKVAMWSVGASVLAALVGGFVWLIATNPGVPDTEILSRKGIHWHPQLTIYVKGVRQELPSNIGIGAMHQPIHTHTEDSAQGVMHLEFDGTVQKQEVTLGQFFKNWGKDIRSFGTNMTMTVNGELNTEYENYVMKEKDKIELRYE